MRGKTKIQETTHLIPNHQNALGQAGDFGYVRQSQINYYIL
jgi:hypothetical protein